METTLPKVLKLLRRKVVTKKELIDRIKEKQVYIEKVLEKLLEAKIIIKSGEFYRYHKTPTTEEFFRKIMTFYKKVEQQEKMELLSNLKDSVFSYFSSLQGRISRMFNLGSSSKKTFDTKKSAKKEAPIFPQWWIG